MFEHCKIFRQHDLNAFTGIDTGTAGLERYQFTKQSKETITCSYLEQFFNETDPEHFLGWGNKDSLKAFPLKTFDSVASALEHCNLEWHSSVADLITDTEYELLDGESLKCTNYFKSESVWDAFNLVVEKNKLSHGFKEYKVGIYYDGA